ncbi:MAG: PH domain-containing protein [Balneolales bacterium]
MFKPRRQHPIAAISNVTGALKEYIVPFVIVVILGGQSEDAQSWYVGGTIILVLLLLIGGILSWFFYTYTIENGELKIEYGVLVRKRHFVQRDRIQVIDVSAGVIQRMFGLVSVEVKTAGESTAETTISAVTREEAGQIQELLRKDGTKETEFIEPLSELRLRNRDLLIAASTAGSFGIALSIIGTITSQLNQVISDSQIYEYIESLSIPGTNLVLMIIVVMILVAWLLSLFGTIIKYSGFTLSRSAEELVIARGLFERKQLTIPYHRIQAVRVVEGILRQPFGFATLYVDSAGYGDESGTSTVLFPLIKKSHLNGFIEKNIPDYKTDVLSVFPPVRALRRYMIRTIIPALILIVPASLLFSFGYLSLILLPLAGWLAVMRYRDAGAGFRGGSLIMRFRNLARTTAIVKKGCIQASEMQSTYFQRRKYLENFIITVASGKTGALFRVSELDRETGNELLAWSSPSSADLNPPVSFEKTLPDW